MISVDISLTPSKPSRFAPFRSQTCANDITAVQKFMKKRIHERTSKGDKKRKVRARSKLHLIVRATSYSPLRPPSSIDSSSQNMMIAGAGIVALIAVAAYLGGCTLGGGRKKK